jgi:hypothetical protein
MSDPGDQNVHPPKPRCEETLELFGEQLRDEAIRAVESPRKDWVAYAYDMICAIPPGTEFVSDYVWARMDEPPDEPRALGAAMMKASRRGVIEETGNYIKSQRPACHARPCKQWRKT